MARTVNFEITQGDTFIINATYKDPDGNLIDVSTHDLLFQVGNEFGGDIICATATKNDGITVDPETKIIRIMLTPEQTKKFTVPKSVYQFQLTQNDGTKITLAKGYFSVDIGVIV